MHGYGFPNDYRSVWVLTRILHRLHPSERDARTIIEDLLLSESKDRSILRLLHYAWVAGWDQGLDQGRKSFRLPRRIKRLEIKPL